MMKNNLSITLVFEASSANYGEGIGNISSLKKITRDNGSMYTYISRQAIRYNIASQMGVDHTLLKADSSVIQFHPDATIQEYPEIDLFGYMKTDTPIRTRTAPVRISNAVSLERFQSDLDFLTNKGLLDRINKQGEKLPGSNLAQSEVHTSFYAYTVTVELDKIGIDENDGIEISQEEKSKRVVLLLDTLKFLYRDIRGRKENLSPIFVIGGLYTRKNPFFEGRIKLNEHKLNISTIESVLKLDEEVKQETKVAYIDGTFANSKEIKDKLQPIEIGEFFNILQQEIKKVYSE